MPLVRSLATLAAVLGAGVFAGGAQAATPYRVVVFGDSYASGEGAPGTAGTYRSDGREPDPRADWTGTADDVDFTGDSETGTLGARRCHRSPRATAPRAVKLLEPEFPDIAFSFRSFACSGARVERGITGPYKGAEPIDDNNKVPAQISQANDYLDELPAATRRIDALVMNIGGNNLGFGNIIQRCTELPLGSNPCSPPDASFNNEGNGDTERIFETGEGVDEPAGDTGLDDLPGLYADLDARIDRTAGGLKLDKKPFKVLLTGAPNPLAGGFGGCSSLTGQYDYENRLRADERAWVNDDIFPRLNGAYNAGAVAEGWSFVPLVSAVPTGMCASSARMINRNRDALTTQGATVVSEVGLGVSHGWVHPKASGYAAMAPLLANALRTAVIERFTPSAEPAGATPVPVVDLASRVELNVGSVGANFETRPAGQIGLNSPVGGPVGADRVEVPVSAVGGPLDSVTAVARRCGPVGDGPGRAGPRGCGPGRSVSPVLVGTPAQPASVAASPDFFGLRVSWQRGSTATLRRFLVEARLVQGSGTGEPARAIVNEVGGPGIPRTDLTIPELTLPVTLQYSFPVHTSEAVLPLPSGSSWQITVRECTDRGCGAGRDVAGARRAGSQVLTSVQASQRQFVQQQIGDFPIGVFSLRTGLSARPRRTLPLLVSWGTWGRWRDLRELRLTLNGRAGLLATLRLDLRNGRVALAPRRGRTRRGRAGRRGSLAAGPVTLDLRGTRLVPGGPRSRLVALRLPLRLARSLRRQRVDVEIGAVAKSGRSQAPAWAGSFTVRR